MIHLTKEIIQQNNMTENHIKDIILSNIFMAGATKKDYDAVKNAYNLDICLDILNKYTNDKI